MDGKFIPDGVTVQNGGKYYFCVEKCYRKFNESNQASRLELWAKIVEKLFMSIRAPPKKEYD